MKYICICGNETECIVADKKGWLCDVCRRMWDLHCDGSKTINILPFLGDVTVTSQNIISEAPMVVNYLKGAMK